MPLYNIHEKFTEKEKRGDQMGNHRDALLRCKEIHRKREE
jgi:hypothetical protein